LSLKAYKLCSHCLKCIILFAHYKWLYGVSCSVHNLIVGCVIVCAVLLWCAMFSRHFL